MVSKLFRFGRAAVKARKFLGPSAKLQPLFAHIWTVPHDFYRAHGLVDLETNIDGLSIPGHGNHTGFFDQKLELGRPYHVSSLRLAFFG